MRNAVKLMWGSLRLAPQKGVGELGTDSHVISRHDDVTAITRKMLNHPGASLSE